MTSSELSRGDASGADHVYVPKAMEIAKGMEERSYDIGLHISWFKAYYEFFRNIIFESGFFHSFFLKIITIKDYYLFLVIASFILE